jgi:hypothetical protein
MKYHLKVYQIEFSDRFFPYSQLCRLQGR